MNARFEMSGGEIVPEPFVGIEEAAKFLAVKVSYVYEQCRLNRMPSYKVGAFRRFKLSELEAWARGSQHGRTDGREGGESDGHV